MDKLSLQNPVFATYAVAASIMILKAVAMSWLTVLRMMQEKGGYRAPEDLRRTLLNPEPDPKQLQANERVERIRQVAEIELAQARDEAVAHSYGPPGDFFIDRGGDPRLAKLSHGRPRMATQPELHGTVAALSRGAGKPALLASRFIGPDHPDWDRVDAFWKNLPDRELLDRSWPALE